MNRKLLQISLWILAITVPLAIHLLMKNINPKTIVNLSALYPFWYAWPYWYIWQSGPFFLLAILCNIKKSGGIFKFNSGCLIGATIGATILSVGPYFLLSCPNQGSTANIGLGILLISMPFCLAVSISLGWFIGCLCWKLYNKENPTA